MEKYSGNQKGFIYASCDAKDQEKVFDKYLEPLARDGISFCWGDAFDKKFNKKEEDNIARSNAVLIFLTKDFAKEDNLRRTVEAAVRNDKPILTVYLENVDLDAGFSMQLESQQALFTSYYESEEEFVEVLKKAAIFDKVEVTEQQKKKQKRRSVIPIAAAVIAVLILAIVIKPLLGPKANADTMEALGLQGLSKSDLENMVTLRVVGKDVLLRQPDWVRYADDGRTKLDYKFNMDMSAPNSQRQTDVGEISDLSGIEQLKNLTTLQLTGQQITDASQAFELAKLKTFIISFNPIDSLDGIEKLKELEYLDISSTNVTEIPDGLHVRTVMAGGSKLSKIPDFGGLDDVYIEADTLVVSDYSNLDTASSYKMLRVDCNEADASQIVSLLKGIPVEKAFLTGLHIGSLNDLSGLDVSRTLCIAGSPLSSLEGIENFEGISELDLKDCHSLTDLSAVNRLKSLSVVRISEDMIPLKDAVDSRIMVTVSYDEDQGEFEDDKEDEETEEVTEEEEG